MNSIVNFIPHIFPSYAWLGGKLSPRKFISGKILSYVWYTNFRLQLLHSVIGDFIQHVNAIY